MPGRVQAIQAAIEAVREARDRHEASCSFRTRVLFDMLLLELGKELATALGKGLPLEPDAERD